MTMPTKLVTMSAFVGALTTCSDTQFSGFSNNPPVKAGAKTSDAPKTVNDNPANEPPLRDAGGGTRPTATCTNGSTVQSDTQEVIFKKPQASLVSGTRATTGRATVRLFRHVIIS